MISIKREEEIKVVEVNTDELEPCKPKIIRIWSWKRMKTVKHIIHIDESGKITQYEIQ